MKLGVRYCTPHNVFVRKYYWSRCVTDLLPEEGIDVEPYDTTVASQQKFILRFLHRNASLIKKKYYKGISTGCEKSKL